MPSIADRLGSHRRLRATSLALVIAVALAGCSSDEPEKKPAKQLPTITPVEGMKYYVGGPVMKYDKYNRLRLGGFNGEVAAPTSRGLLLGFKVEPDGKHFDYRTWLNGRAVSKSIGFLDADGLLWFSQRDTLDSAGKIVAQQMFEYDDTKKIMTSTVKQMDPATGEIVNTHKQEMPYTPPEEPDDDDDLFDDDEEEEEEKDEGGAK